MPDNFSLDNLLTLLPLAIPVAVLLTLLAVLLAGVWRRRKARKLFSLIETDLMRRDNQRTNRHSPESDALIEPAPAAVDILEATEVVGNQSPSRVAPSNGAGAAPLNVNQPPAAAAAGVAPSPSSIVDKITAAEASNRTAELAPLYLELARAYEALGRADEALKALRSCAGVGAMHGPPLVHAQSRVELAEAAFKAGDLTGACEQWQIAKATFHDHGQQEAHALVDKRMRDTGCPTDWVLTEF